MGRPGSFARRIAAGLVATLTVALVITTTAVLALRLELAADEQLTMEHTRVLLDMGRLQRAFSAKLSSGRGHALTGDASFLAEEQQARQRFLDIVQQLREHSEDERERALLDAVAQAEREHEEAIRLVVEATGRGVSRERVAELFRERVSPARERVSEALSRLAQYTEQRLLDDARRARESERRARWFILAGSVLGLLLAAVLAWVLTRALPPLHYEAEASEERFRLLVEGVRDYALYLLGPQGRVASWNPGAERITGWSASEIIDQSGGLLYPPEELAAGRPREELARAEREGRLRTEGWRARKEGSRFWAESLLTALRDPQGRLKGYAVLTRDISERKRLEDSRRLFSEAERLFSTLEDPDQAVAELARLTVPELADGCALFLSSPTGEMLPRAVAHVSPEKERLIWELSRMVPETRGLPLGAWEVLRSGRSRRVAEVSVAQTKEIFPDPRHLELLQRLDIRSYMLVPLRVGERSLGVLALLSHRPELRFTETDQVFLEELAGRAALALENARLLREAQAALELVGVAAHDLGNSLHTLQLQLGKLRRSPPADPRKLREGLGSALRSTQRQGRLLHNLLDLSRLSSGRLELELGEVDLVELVREVVAGHAEQAEEAGSRLVLEVEQEVVGQWDRLRLERVVSNLLSNALKYGKGQPIEVRAERTESLARLVVRDHGPGIPPEEQRRIFERFRKARAPSDGRRRAGFGLGLYIVRQLVEAHGGSIRVESTPGEGATFTVELPLVPAFREADASAHPSGVMH